MARKGQYLCKTLMLPDGRRKYIYGKTKEELEEKVIEARLALKLGVKLDDETTVGELVKLWYDTEIKGTVKPQTDAEYRQIINNYVLPTLAPMRIKDVKPQHIRLVLNGTSKKSRVIGGIVLRCLRGAFGIAEENNLIVKSPVLARFKASGKSSEARHALSKSEESSIMQALKDHVDHYNISWFLLSTGLRIGEALALRWEDIDLKGATVTVSKTLVGDNIQEATKSTSGTRQVPLPYDLCRSMRLWYSRDVSEYVFIYKNNTHFTDSQFRGFWTAAQRLCGPDGKRVRLKASLTPHVFRHTYCTRCFEAGMDIKEVQYLMGHSSPDITLKVYTDYCAESRKDQTFATARRARANI